MTVAVGVVSPSGLIIAADSQEDWGGVKRPSRKIRHAHVIRRTRDGMLEGRIAVTGAGGSDYLEYIKTRILGGVEKRQINPQATPSEFIADVGEVIEEEMADFFQEHYAPVAHLHRDEEPSVIVGAVLRRETGLWVTHGSTVRRVDFGHAAVGSGALWARNVLDLNISQFVGEHAATLTACYVIHLAKENDGYCGKDTDVLSLMDGVDYADPDAVRAAESVFRKYGDLQDWILSYILAPGVDWNPSWNEQLNEFRTELGKINFYLIRQHGVSTDPQ